MINKVEDYKGRIDSLMKTVNPMNDYRDTFVKHCNDYGPRISTGLLSLDIALNGGMANELYIMGAETSTGKSAFMMSIAQKVAEQGIDVIYFALEMGRDEFVARGISAISFEHYKKGENVRKWTASNILYWTYDDFIKDFTKVEYSYYKDFTDEYFNRYGNHLHIIEGGTNGLSVKDIANVSSLKKKAGNGKPMVVFIDYLQLIRADAYDRSQADRKTKIDVTVTTLKTLASQIGMPVMTISSVPRSGYGDKVSTASFKESGDTEYTGGVIIGWNWIGVTTESDTQKKDEEIQRCRERGWRQMEFDVLKYRNSERYQSVHLKYYPAYSSFEELSNEDIINLRIERMEEENKKQESKGKGPVLYIG